MATLIPSLSGARHRMTSGERRFAERLEDKLEDDYLLWYDVPVGNQTLHPDFIVLHPRRGLLILEVKDWKLETIFEMDKLTATLNTPTGIKRVVNPFEQARSYAQIIANLLEKDISLRSHESSKYGSKLVFPWSYGVVLSNITRLQFDKTNLSEVIPPHRVICKDEMVETVENGEFQQRLWDMFPWEMTRALSLPQIDRVRWHLFPEIRIASQDDLFANSESQADIELPDIIKIMDLQQEQLARSLGEGHRIIHGVAGSGKTMILGYRCLHLAKALNKPILVLCYNVVLASKLQRFIQEKGISHQVNVSSFHAWCAAQLRAFHVTIPTTTGSQFFNDMVQSVINAVDRGQIPHAQYGAILIDEGHDFQPEWLKLIVQMVSPETNSLLVLYDDAQSIYGNKKSKISFKALGIQAQGRTTILKLNYRNTAEILKVAQQFAQEILSPTDADEDSIPLIKPESASRHGPMPVLIKMPYFVAEVNEILHRFMKLKEQGYEWGDMAVVYRSQFMGKTITDIFEKSGIPVSWLTRDTKSRKAVSSTKVSVVTMHSSKGLEFPIVAIPGLGYFPKDDDEISEEVRLMYVGMTRAMDHLMISCHQSSRFVERLEKII